MAAATAQLEQMLSYYRMKVDSFEKERIEWQESAEAIRQQLESVHENEKRVNQFKIEISEIQKCLSDSHLAVYDERQQAMNLKREFDALMLQDREDKRKIMDLYALNEDIENTNANGVKECRPGQSTSVMSATSADSQSKKIKKTNMAISTSSQQKMASKDAFVDQFQKHSNKVERRKQLAQSGVIKTVIMPHEDMNRLGVEAEELRCFLNAQGALFEEAIRGYQKDKIVREEEFRLKEEDFKATLRQLTARLQTREDENMKIGKEFFNHKHQAQKQKQLLIDDQELLKVEAEALRAQLDQILHKQGADVEYAEKLFEKKSKNFAARFRKETKTNENDLAIVKEQYAAVQEKFIKELKRVEGELKNTKQRYRLLESRKDTESQAFQSDVQTLRKKVQEYERQIKKLKQHVDEERTERLIQELKNSTVGEMELGNLIEDITKVEDEVKEARKLKEFD